MHPLTKFFNYLKRSDFSLALIREHVGDRELTEWYPEWIYELMETDEVRNQAYRGAIQEVIADKVVLELGTGRKALWAVFCARAGARRVYAIEANRRAYQASLELVRSQGIENVHLIHGFSDTVELPERCDVLVHDLVGDIASSEGMVPFIEDAKQRLLAAHAVHVPRRCATHVMLAEDPELSRAEWALSYALRGFRNFDSMSFVRFFGFPCSAALSEPQIFEDFALDLPVELQTSRKLEIEIMRDGELRGVCFFIRLHLSQTRTVDTLASQTSWATPYVRFKEGTFVRRGDVVDMSIRSDLSGNPCYSLKLVHRSHGSEREVGQYTWSGD